MHSMCTRQLRSSLAVRFVGERAVGTGVLREWITGAACCCVCAHTILCDVSNVGGHMRSLTPLVQ
jgi:hypothetical protein